MAAQKGFSAKSKRVSAGNFFLIFSVLASKFPWVIYYLGIHWIIVPGTLSELAGLCLCCRSLAMNCKKILPFLLFLPRFFDFIFYLFLNFSYRHQYRATAMAHYHKYLKRINYTYTYFATLTP
jgi:hypothetical protein